MLLATDLFTLTPNNASLGMQQLSNTDGKPLIFNSGESIHSNFDSFNGYLVDENYFADCGGAGGGSSSVTIDYDSLASIISSDTTFITNVGGGIGGSAVTLNILMDMMEKVFLFKLIILINILYLLVRGYI
ncbi:MAG: hypothetical protein CM15mP112_05330 [Flavobacteriales bacterium]|nr:MAG: hypothetical protein CM15mP112_05330 [Flavobacteriales bacterium]